MLRSSVLITNIGISVILFGFTHFLQKEVAVVFVNVNFESRKASGGELGYSHVSLSLPSKYVSCLLIKALKIRILELER